MQAYKKPSTYDPLMGELRAAASALEPVADSGNYMGKLRRLGFYILRTALYARTAELGTPVFDVDRAARVLEIPGLDRLLRRRHEDPMPGDIQELFAYLNVLLGKIPENRWNSVEALSVALTGVHPYAASLLAQTLLLEDNDGFEYTALTPPPL